MAFPENDVIGILSDNLRLRSSVLPLSARKSTHWTHGLGLKQGGETVLYTGGMYQLLPYIEGLVKAEKKLGNTFLANYTALGRRVNKVVSLTGFLAHPSAATRARFDEVPINVVHLLRKAGVEFGALFKDDLYSGALAYDLGLDEVVLEHARKVHAAFVRNGVRTVITIDPHTTHMLRTIYPKLLHGYSIEVRSYLEVLADKGLGATSASPGGDGVVLHDSCVFARHEGVVDAPRQLLASAGVQVREPEFTGRQTWCCGGPVESLYPEKAEANARKRVAQLQLVSNEAVTMCPMCFVNLSGAAGDSMQFRDISQYLREAYA